MTLRPGTHLRFDPDAGVLHAHSDDELASGKWRPGAECAGCPEARWDRAQAQDGEATQPITQVFRKRRGT
jgi:hypothetical protein